MVAVIGIDCAVQDENVGLARALWDGRRTEVAELAKGGQGLPVVEIIREWIGDSTTTLLALDAPLGWPTIVTAE
jgi:predicted RNase H-like nuclease